MICVLKMRVKSSQSVALAAATNICLLCVLKFLSDDPEKGTTTHRHVLMTTLYSGKHGHAEAALVSMLWQLTEAPVVNPSTLKSVRSGRTAHP